MFRVLGFSKSILPPERAKSPQKIACELQILESQWFGVFGIRIVGSLIIWGPVIVVTTL